MLYMLPLAVPLRLPGLCLPSLSYSLTTSFNLFVGLYAVASCPLLSESHLLHVQRSSYVCFCYAVNRPLHAYLDQHVWLLLTRSKDRRCLFIHNLQGSALSYYLCIVWAATIYSLIFCCCCLFGSVRHPWLENFKTVCSLIRSPCERWLLYSEV